MENNDKGVLCEDMLAEILSRLPIKSLMRFKCLSKYFQSFILDPRLARMHLQKSPKTPNFLISYRFEGKKISYLVSSPISSLIEDSQHKRSCIVDIIKGSKPHRKKDRVLGSCNGLVCLAKWNKNGIKFNLWNPATKEEFGNLTLAEKDNLYMLGFGYDNSRDSYKVVAIVGNLNTVDKFPYKTLIGGPNDGSCWREIQDFPSIPSSVEGDAVYVNNSLNWLGIPTYDDSDDSADDLDSVITLDGVVIVSLDLETETYTQMLLPRELKGLFIGYFSCCTVHILHCNEAPLIGVLGGCLSVFVHDRETQHFSIWQMKEFGNQRSWTLLMNTSLKDLEFCTDDPLSILLPLCMVENDRDIVIIHSSFQYCVKQTIVYNLRDKTVTFRNMTPNLLWIYPFQYVESLVSPYCIN